MKHGNGSRESCGRAAMWLVGLVVIGVGAFSRSHAQSPGSSAVGRPENFVNSLGMRFVRLPAGRFRMGQERGAGWDKVKMLDRSSAETWLDSTTHTDWDEVPAHEVVISRPFAIAATEVTNIQYEQFDPAHRRLRGKRGFSKEDDEAVIFVSWHEATAFCDWLARKEGRPYRLPTEAEWEYAARAGTTTPFSTGDSLPAELIRQQALEYAQDYTPVSLRVGRWAANPWGLFDAHGNVEEWVADWYGPYEAESQTDPTGRAGGLFRVARGGSHNTTPAYLRSANRMGTLPEDRSALIGFRCAIGERPATKPLPVVPDSAFTREVGANNKFDWSADHDEDQPLWVEPIPFVRAPASGFVGWHNHQPSITWAPNGNLLTVFFSTHRERGREMVVMGTRLRQGRQEWDPASVIFYAPDRNVTGASIFHDGRGKLHLLGGLDEAQYWSKLAMVSRTSVDSGATWSAPEIVSPEHVLRNQLIHGMIQTRENNLVQLADAAPGQDGGSAVWLSAGGSGWKDLGAERPRPGFAADTTGAWVAGIHGRVVQLGDGSLLAMGRGDPIGNRLTMSVSRDMGKNWTYRPTEFPPLRGGQRLVLRRLREGPLLFVGFTDPVQAFGDPFDDFRVSPEKQAYKITDQSLDRMRRAGLPESVVARMAIERREVVKSHNHARSLIAQHLGAEDARRYGDEIIKHLEPLKPRGIIVRDAAGRERRVYGMFAALSFDDGKTWPVRKLLTPGGRARVVDCYGWVQKCFIDDTHAEIGGYLADTQTPDGVIHLISSGLHYRFNLAWLKQPMPAAE